MAATIKLRVCTGTNASEENVGIEDHAGGIAFRSNDSADYQNPEDNPITIPSTGINRSYEKWIRFLCTVAPATQVTNFKVWGPNTQPATGLTVYWGTTATGATPTDSDSTIATIRQDTNFYSQATAINVSGTLTASGQETDFLVMQLDVESTATQGNMPQQTYNYSYDEN